MQNENVKDMELWQVMAISMGLWILVCGGITFGLFVSGKITCSLEFGGILAGGVVVQTFLFRFSALWDG